MSCSEKDLDEADAENPAENDVAECLSDFYSEKVVNDGESCLENDLKPSRAHVLSEEKNCLKKILNLMRVVQMIALMLTLCLQLSLIL